MEDVEPKKRTGIRIVIVDNHPIWLAGLRSVLKNPRFRIVDKALSCADAVYVAARVNPDLLIIGPCAEMDANHVQTIIKNSPETIVVMLVDENAAVFGDREVASSAIEYLPAFIGCNELIDAITGILTKSGRLIAPVPSDVAADRDSHCPELPAPLTRRELEVLRLMAAGLRNHEIAGKLFVARSTVKTHVEHIINKLGVANRLQAATWAIRHKLATSDELLR